MYIAARGKREHEKSGYFLTVPRINIIAIIAEDKMKPMTICRVCLRVAVVLAASPGTYHINYII